MNTQMDRWKQNSTWSKIVATKQVFIEPRKGADLTAIMKYYREVIRDTTDGPSGGISGALFLAVFRGKVAEGIDFKDNEARCVVTVSILYLSSCFEVTKKFKYPFIGWYTVWGNERP